MKSIHEKVKNAVKGYALQAPWKRAPYSDLNDKVQVFWRDDYSTYFLEVYCNDALISILSNLDGELEVPEGCVSLDDVSLSEGEYASLRVTSDLSWIEVERFWG